MPNVIMQATKQNYEEILQNQNVSFDNILIQEGEIYYNNVTSSFMINEPGMYYFNWSVVTQALNSHNGVMFSILVNQTEIFDNSMLKQGQINGFGVFQVSQIPVEVSLVNRSDNSVYLATNVLIKANILINKLPDVISQTSPYIELEMLGTQTLQYNDFLVFSNTYLNNVINYDTSLNLVAITEPGIYQISLYFFSNATTIKMNSISYPGDRDFDLPSGYGYKYITFLYKFEEANYIGFSNPTNSNFTFGLSGQNQNGGLVITKISEL